MVSLIQNGETYDVIESCHYAIKHFHNIAGKRDPTDTKLNDYVLDTAKRTCRRQRKKKHPITKDIIVKIFNLLEGNNMTLLNLRNFTMMVLAFAGFFRYEEVSKLKFGDLIFEESYLRVFVEKSKTDQFREGAWVFIANSSSDICPVKNLKKYLEKAGISSQDEYLFRATTFFKTTKSYRLRKNNKPISYSTTRTAILNCVKGIGLDEKMFGTHSLRRGGATSAANMGVKDRLFQNHGRWKSVKAKDGYVDDNIESILSVSLGLGL